MATVDAARFTARSTDDDSTIVVPAFDVVLYTTAVLTDVAPAVLDMYDRYLRLIPPGVLCWYLTENMSRHKPVTPRTLQMLQTWLRPDAPKREILNIELRDGADFTEPAEFTFFVYGWEPAHLHYQTSANMVRFVFPFTWATERRADVFSFVRETCDMLPFQSGHSGYVLQTSKYTQRAAERAAWALSMRYPGFDIRNEVSDFLAVRDAVKGANWLTMLGDDLLKELGGATAVGKALDAADVTIIPVNGGLILQAGPRPLVVDVDSGEDISAYRAVYEVIAPLQAKARDRYGAFSLPSPGHVENTERWLTRLSDV